MDERNDEAQRRRAEDREMWQALGIAFLLAVALLLAVYFAPDLLLPV